MPFLGRGAGQNGLRGSKKKRAMCLHMSLFPSSIEHVCQCQQTQLQSSWLAVLLFRLRPKLHKCSFSSSFDYQTLLLMDFARIYLSDL